MEILPALHVCDWLTRGRHPQVLYWAGQALLMRPPRRRGKTRGEHMIGQGLDDLKSDHMPAAPQACYLRRGKTRGELLFGQASDDLETGQVPSVP